MTSSAILVGTRKVSESTEEPRSYIGFGQVKEDWLIVLQIIGMVGVWKHFHGARIGRQESLEPPEYRRDSLIAVLEQLSRDEDGP